MLSFIRSKLKSLQFNACQLVWGKNKISDAGSAQKSDISGREGKVWDPVNP